MWPVSKHPGFTLIELIISIAIIGLLSAIVFGNFVTENRSASVRQGANQIALDLQKMYSYALSGRNQTNPVNANFPRPDWYGIYILKNATSYSTRYFFSKPTDDPPGTVVLQNRPLPGKTKIADIKTDGTTRNSATIEYAIPGGTMSFVPWTTNTVLEITVASTVTPTLTSCITITRNVSVVNVGPCT